MVAAYLKIWVAVGAERSVRDALKRMDGISRADITTGEQDLIALLEASDHASLLERILNDVRPVEGIERTVTNLVLD